MASVQINFKISVIFILDLVADIFKIFKNLILPLSSKLFNQRRNPKARTDI